MKRRTFLNVAGAGSAAVAAPAVAQSKPTIRWRLQSIFPRSLLTQFETTDLFTRHVAEITEGQFQVQTFYAGEIVGAFQAFDAVGSGTIESCSGRPTSTPGRTPPFR